MLPVVVLLPVVAEGWRRAWNAPRGRLALRVLLVLSVVHMLLLSTAPKREHHRARLAALAWVAEHSAPDEAIVVRRRRDGWYAGRPVILGGPPYDEAQLLAAMRAHRGAFVVLTAERVEQREPAWLGPDGALRVVERFTEAGAETVLVLAPSDRALAPR